MTYCIKFQEHDGHGGCGDKVVCEDYLYQTREEANAAVVENAEQYAASIDVVTHSAPGLSVVVRPGGSYATYNTSGDRDE